MKTFDRLIAILLAIGVFGVATFVLANRPPSGQTALYTMGEQYISRWDDDATSNVIALTNSSQQFTIPEIRNNAYQICAFGNNAYILGGSNPTATTSIGGYTDIISDGGCTRLFKFDCVDADEDEVCDARKVAFIANATVTGAVIIFKRYDPTL